MTEPTPPRGERILAKAHVGDADQKTWALATAKALYVGDAILAWDRILKAQWEEPWLTLEVRSVDELGTDQLRYQLENSRKFLDVLRDRVTASVIFTERRTLGNGVVGTFTARRRSADGSIHWTVLFDGNPDISDAALRAEADGVLADLRGSLGI